METISVSVKKKDHDAKLTGRARYVADYPSDGVLCGKLYRSTKARAKILAIHIPPLHQHADDIPIIARSIVERLSRSYNEDISITDAANQLLMRYRWPGNVRELENIIERGFVNARLRDAEAIDVVDFDNMMEFEQPRQNAADSRSAPAVPQAHRVNISAETVPAADSAADNLESAEKAVISKCLEKNRGNISATAKELGMARNTLYQRIRKYGL